MIKARAGGKILCAARQDIDTFDPHVTNRAATRKIPSQVLDTVTVSGPRRRRPVDGNAEQGVPQMRRLHRRVSAPPPGSDSSSPTFTPRRKSGAR